MAMINPPSQTKPTEDHHFPACRRQYFLSRVPVTKKMDSHGSSNVSKFRNLKRKRLKLFLFLFTITQSFQKNVLKISLTQNNSSDDDVLKISELERCEHDCKRTVTGRVIVLSPLKEFTKVNGNKGHLFYADLLDNSGLMRSLGP